MVERANAIIGEYALEGFTLTLRQLYYQFVARGLIPNKTQEYKRLGSVINDARLAGLIDWDAVEDRTRGMKGTSHWADPSDILRSAASSFRLDKWSDQPYYVEVWVEKDALVGVVERACGKLDLNYLSCRGYTSQSEMWEAAMRLVLKAKKNRNPVIIHLGDHDPSGLDMTRDIRDRLATFCAYHGAAMPAVIRIALNMDQVRQYNPPPNPAKVTDSRYAQYMEKYGTESWELDALDPKVLEGLIARAVKKLIDLKRYQAKEREEGVHRTALEAASERWEDVADFLNS